MAVIYQATLNPSKSEVIAQWLARTGSVDGPVERLGAYRYDDPDGEVGVEGHLVRAGGEVRHVLLTYRGSPEPTLADALVATMEHSTLGTRWIYDGTVDPVAQGCLARALAGDQPQALPEIWDGDQMIGIRDPDVRVAPEGEGETRDAHLVVLEAPTEVADHARRLVASWAGGSGVIAYLSAHAEGRV